MLSNIKTPNDIKTMKYPELEALALKNTEKIPRKKPKITNIKRTTST